jgi:hypothetical protein
MSQLQLPVLKTEFLSSQTNQITNQQNQITVLTGQITSMKADITLLHSSLINLINIYSILLRQKQFSLINF